MIGTAKSVIKVMRGELGRILVAFSYNPAFVNKIKTISGHRWHPEEKYWSFPGSDETLEKILKVDDIKDYLLYYVEKKKAATSTVNQAINALKFFMGLC